MSAATEATVKRLERAVALIEGDAPLLAVRFGDDAYVVRDGEEITLEEWSQEPQRITVHVMWEE